jgi:hypothetical protein
MLFAPILIPLVMASYNTINTFKFADLLDLTTVKEELINYNNPYY